MRCQDSDHSGHYVIPIISPSHGANIPPTHQLRLNLIREESLVSWYNLHLLTFWLFLTRASPRNIFISSSHLQPTRRHTFTEQFSFKLDQILKHAQTLFCSSITQSLSILKMCDKKTQIKTKEFSVSQIFRTKIQKSDDDMSIRFDVPLILSVISWNWEN